MPGRLSRVTRLYGGAPHAQTGHRVRFDWGLDGALAVASGADVAVVVDVLSFTTAVGVALDAGTEVLPYRWADDTAAAFAERHDAVLARPRSAAGPGDLSLSPVSIRAASGVRRLVLPSPNGSTICWHLAEELGVPTVLAASLRNASAVARWVVGRPDARRTTVAVVAAGERWPGGALRPAVEDAWGAAAVLRGLVGGLVGELLGGPPRPEAPPWETASPEAAAPHALSPEARSVAALAPHGDVAAELAGCASGRELVADGYAGDVRVAAEVDGSGVVPGLVDGRFVDLART